MERGLFIVLEGVDGSGTTTQTSLLHNHFKNLSKYNDVLTTHEPWRDKEIKKVLKEDKDAYSNGIKMAELYITDRENHQKKLINPVLEAGGIVLCDRYHLSTFAYQGVQGVSIGEIKRIHNKKKILNPDLTLFLDIDLKTARKRIKKRGEPLEKFEKNKEFTQRLIEGYQHMVKIAQTNQTILGPIITIDGKNPIEEVAEDIKIESCYVYDRWAEYNFH